MKVSENEGEEKGLSHDELFDKKKFNTILVNGETFNSASQEHSDLIERILDPALQRSELEELFILLKKEKLGTLLFETSEQEKEPSRKSKLLAACWEIGFDATDYLLQVTKMVFHQDFQVALEALTLLETIENAPPSESLGNALNWAQQHKAPHPDLAGPAIQHLKNLS